MNVYQTGERAKLEREICKKLLEREPGHRYGIKLSDETVAKIQVRIKNEWTMMRRQLWALGVCDVRQRETFDDAVTLYERLRSEHLSYEEAIKVVEEELEKLKLNVESMLDERANQQALDKQLKAAVFTADQYFDVVMLYERLRSEGLSHEEATKVVEEEVEIQKLEAKGMTRSDAQGVIELNDPNHPSNKGAKDASDS